MKVRLVIAASAIALFAAESFAQMGGGERGQRPEFSAIDTNEDGTVTLEEMSAFDPDRAEMIFGHMDSNEDGVLSEEEFNTPPPRGGGGGMGG